MTDPAAGGRPADPAGARPLRHPALAIPGVLHAFGTRAADPRAGLPCPVARLRQVHGCEVVFIGPDTPLEGVLAEVPHRRPAADALVSVRRGLALGIATADCVPVLLACRDGRAVAAAHAGWRGLALGVLPATVATLARETGCAPARCVAVLGPAIGAGAYVVGADVRTALRAAGAPQRAFAPVEAAPGRFHCDLRAIGRWQLQACGLPSTAVHAMPDCTYTRPELYHSYRRDGDAAGRMLSLIALAG